MKVAELLSGEASADAGTAALDVTGITADSRAVKPGNMFVAVAGSKTDGLRFISQAMTAGAVAIAAERRPESLPPGVGFIQASNARRFLARSAAKFFPRQPATIAAVTGTSGKTSVAAFTRQIWAALGHRAASIGTVGVVTPEKGIYGSLTTPDPVVLHRQLDALADEGVTHLALEASSHGLDQHRLDGVRIAAAAFTNLSRDHLDYHPTLEAYFAAKLRLFAELIEPSGTAIINVDHEQAVEVTAAARRRQLTVLTIGRKADGIRLLEAGIDGFAQKLRIAFTGRQFSLRLPLVGAFQVENALTAAGLVIATGSDADKVFAALEKLQGAKGRLELAGEHDGAPVFIDYAHKPDALAKALEALRPYVTGRLVVVLGAGGDRDAGKRPMMGAIAVEKADRVIVTDDNPRSEKPAAIRAEILAGARGAREIGDRGEAIRTAVSELKRGDVLLIAGKGHETGQIIGDKVLPFSDHEAVATALKGTA
ncbi:MAG TPA: UDP-N-acetylmuramoyl-L-alanyl-D-glutamate--2,6-diaminopimelate ligase [Xanthobacteraceae bacterium]|nr:UDP-N-acetylmuramoyl-L-alanyl-D-glutamate--2,6-diaminopimelate ligase [Xanthobacteraceae bacterium]